MKNLITELLYYKSGVSNEIDYGNEYKKTYEKNYGLYQKLRSLMTEEVLKIFDEYEDLSIACQCTACEANFKEGVKIGVRLIIDCLNND